MFTREKASNRLRDTENARVDGLVRNDTMVVCRDSRIRFRIGLLLHGEPTNPAGTDIEI